MYDMRWVSRLIHRLHLRRRLPLLLRLLRPPPLPPPPAPPPSSSSSSSTGFLNHRDVVGILLTVRHDIEISS